MSRIKLKRQKPDAATRRRIKDGLRCGQCLAEAKLTFTTRDGLTATVDHLPECREVPAAARAAGRTAYQVTEPEVWASTIPPFPAPRPVSPFPSEPAPVPPPPTGPKPVPPFPGRETS